MEEERDDELEDFENEDEDADVEGPMVTEGFLTSPPPDLGTPGFRERVWICI